MAFVSMLFVYLIIIIVIVCSATFTAILLFIVSAALKKRQLAKKKNAELIGDNNYQIKKTYIILKVFGFICMTPLMLCIIVIFYAVISASIETHTSLYYNVSHLNTARVEKILNKGITPDCTQESNHAAIDGEKTLLYLLADGMLYNETNYKVQSKESLHDETLNMMRLLIEKGADVNYVVYREDKDYVNHGYEDEYSIYKTTDSCGWTPLMMATYQADLDMIKLLTDNGADVNAVDYCGYNVIDIVADYLDDENGYEILNYYLDKGVDPNNVTNFNQNAVWLAYRKRSGNSSLKNDKILAELERLNNGVSFGP